MTAQVWAADIAIFISVMGFSTALLRFYIKAILHELMPNSGNSLRDRIDVIEQRQMHIHDLLVEAAIKK